MPSNQGGSDASPRSLLLVVLSLIPSSTTAQAATRADDNTTFEWAQTVHEADPLQFAGLDLGGVGLRG